MRREAVEKLLKEKTVIEHVQKIIRNWGKVRISILTEMWRRQEDLLVVRRYVGWNPDRPDNM